MFNKFIIICLVLILILLAGCETNPDTVVISVDATPEREYAAQNTEAETPSPTETPTPEITPEPTPTEEVYVFIEELEHVDSSGPIYFNHWEFFGETQPFVLDSTVYAKGIGIYVKAREITDKSGSVTHIWALNGTFTKLSFDLGCEQTLQYDEIDKYGTFKIEILADGQVLFDSGFNDFEHIQKDVVISLPDGADTLSVRLTQTKGINGTLNVVLGSFKIYSGG